MGIEYKREFFDRDYSLGETYGRVWKYARRYRLRIVIGIVTGMLTAGTLVPLFQVIQPALEKVSANEVEAVIGEDGSSAAGEPAAEAPAPSAHAEGKHQAKSKLERELAAKATLPSWYPKAEKIARKCGIELQTSEGGMSGALLLIAVFVIPLIAVARFGLLFLSQYCLTWAGTKVVADLRVDILRKIQEQSMQFYGRIDVGQLMTRATADPQPNSTSTKVPIHSAMHFFSNSIIKPPSIFPHTAVRFVDMYIIIYFMERCNYNFVNYLCFLTKCSCFAQAVPEAVQRCKIIVDGFRTADLNK